jgi:hypothetical protein
LFRCFVVSQGGSLASPLTVRVALSLGPVFIFALELIEGRLVSSPYSLAAAGVYSFFAIGAAGARQRATRSAAGGLSPGRAGPQNTM